MFEYDQVAPGANSGLCVVAIRTSPLGVQASVRFQRTRAPKPLAVGKRGAVAYRNAASHGAFVYIELRPATRTVEYTLRITAARR